MRYTAFINLTLIAVLPFISCHERREARLYSPDPEQKEASGHLIDSFGKVGYDQSTFQKIRCGLYVNSKGDLAYKVIDNSMKFDHKPIEVFLTSVYNADLSDSLNDSRKELKFVIDTGTFKILGDFFFKDKNHIYDFIPMMDGGTIAINQLADVKTFKVLDGGFYAKDNKHCYYRGYVIEDADLKSFIVYDTAYAGLLL
jgi:hypothetical protein